MSHSLKCKAHSQVFIQFAKKPVTGQVKTRLAKSLGDDLALQVHLELVRLAFGQMQQAASVSSAAREFWLSASTTNAQIAALIDNDVRVCIQQGDDLGERMAHALAQGLRRYQKVVLIGSDCPTIDPPYYKAALSALDNHDLVLGPAEDGGYVLIACKQFNAELFRDVAWGGAEVQAQTIANAERLGFSYSLLEARYDIDDITDYRRWRGSN